MTEYTGLAKRVYDDMMAMDDASAAMYGQIVVAECLQYDMEHHRDLLQHRIDSIVAKRASEVQAGLKKSYISKALKGEGTDHLEAASTVLAKAGFGDLTTEDRRRYAAIQGHDASGRFKSKNLNIHYIKGAKPNSGRVSRSRGIPNVRLNDHDKAQYQQAYSQVSDLLDEFRYAPVGSASISTLWREADGSISRVSKPLSPDDNPSKLLPTNKFNGTDKKLISAEVLVDGGLNVDGAAFNLVGSLAGPQAGGLAAWHMNPENKSADRMGVFADQWNAAIKDNPSNPSNRIFTRIKTGSDYLNYLGGDSLPMKAQLALGAANMIAEHGPEAQKVIGPRATRAAYRYRGVERKPDPMLQASVTAFHNDAVKRGHGPDAARLAMRSGRWESRSNRPGENLGGRLVNGVWTPSKSGQGPGSVYVPSPIVSYLTNRLANADLTDLQLKSGVVPPSEGIIIDKKGKVITQAVGYGDDWYLPFNLKTISKLKGGDYIRTRAWGGITTEDVYTGLMAGARSVTVISHNGTYTMEFDDSLRGTRRYSDKAARMVKRYGHLLDAVKSQQVTLLGVPEDRLDELKAVAAKEFNPARRENKSKYEGEVRTLVEEEKADPQMSVKRKNDLADDFLTEVAQNRFQTKTGFAQDWSQMAAKHVDDVVEGARKEHELGYQGRYDREYGGGVSSFDESVVRQVAGGKVATASAAIQELGLQTQWESRLKAAENEYRAAQRPLNLDGVGYDKALQALAEQFPYYLKKPTYIPNQNRISGGRADGGYVKPKFNRPEGATGGYYDETITGAGKVTADEIGIQNPSIKVSEVKAAQRKKADEKKEEKTKIFDTKPSSGATGSKEDRLDAMLAIREHIRKADIFKDGKKYSADDAAADFKDALPIAYAMDESEFVTNFHKDMTGFIKQFDADIDKYVKVGGRVDDTLRMKYKNPERAVQGTDWYSRLAATDNPPTFNFGHEFGPGRTPEQYEDAVQSVLNHMDEEDRAQTGDLNGFIKRQADAIQLCRQNASEDYRERDIPKYEDKMKDASKIKQARKFQEEAQRKLDAAKAAHDAEMERAQFNVVPLNDAPEAIQQGVRQRAGLEPGFKNDKTIPH